MLTFLEVVVTINSYGRVGVCGMLIASVIAAVLQSPATARAAAPASEHVLAQSAPASTNSTSIALGAEVKPTKGQTEQQAITAFESTTGHKLAYTRDYLLWDSPFPTAYEQWLGARGTMPLISVKPQTMSGAAVPWASIATAQPGSAIYTQLKRWADAIKAFGYPVYFTFNHEPEAAASNNFGTAADFIAAWRRVHDVFVAEGAANAKFMWTMTSFAFIVPTSDRRYAWNWYPGDAYVDALGADAYTAFTCDNPGGVWHPLAYQISGYLKFGAQHPNKPMWLPELGVVEDAKTSGRKAQWIKDSQDLFKTAPYQQFAGVAWFNETRPGTACDWRISTSASAQAAFSAMAQDPFYQGSAQFTSPAVSASFNVKCSALSCAFDGSGSTGSAPLTYNFSFGDGATSTLTSPPHSYGSPGTYQVTLTVTDSTGGTASSTQSVTVAAASIAYVGKSSTAGTGTTETVHVPSTVTAGNGLVLIATDGTSVSPAAPTGWALAGTSWSPTMYGAIWQRVATTTDAGSAVTVRFGGVDHGSVELLAYSGTSPSSPVQSAVGATKETTTATLTTPPLAGAPGQTLLSYWAARTSVDATVTPPATVTTRSNETGTGGGRITSASGDSDSAIPGGISANATPAAGHSVTWSILLSPAS
jgi:PKD repeat protein